MADNIKEQFLVVVDFSQNNSYLSAGNYSIKLTFDGIDVDDFSSTSLGFSIEEKRTFEITSSVSEVDVNTEFELSYNLSDISAEESGYVGKKLSLVINCLKLLPMDSYILLNDTNKYYLNNDNEFIIPLSDVQNGSGSTKLKLVSNMLSVEEEKYVMNTELWVSSTANAILPKFGTLVAQTEITLVNPKVSSPSLKIIGMDERIIKDTYGEKVLSYQYDGDSYCRTKVELYQKVGSGYQKLTNALNQVNGSTTHNMGTFDIASVNGKNDITFMLSSLLQEGTYRLVLKVFSSNEEQLIEVPYNFLIDN